MEIWYRDWWEELTENDKTNIPIGIRNYELNETMGSEVFWKTLGNDQSF